MRGYAFFLLLNSTRMYNEIKSSPSSQPEHKVIAMDFANTMLEKFNPKECNEILLLIRQRWSEHRLMEIEKAEKQIAYIKESLSEI